MLAYSLSNGDDFSELERAVDDLFIDRFPAGLTPSVIYIFKILIPSFIIIMSVVAITGVEKRAFNH